MSSKVTVSEDGRGSYTSTSEEDVTSEEEDITSRRRRRVINGVKFFENHGKNSTVVKRFKNLQSNGSSTIFLLLKVIVREDAGIGGSEETVYLNSSSMAMSYTPIYFPDADPSNNYTTVWKFTEVGEDDLQGYEVESLITPGAFLNVRGQGDVRSIHFRDRGDSESILLNFERDACSNKHSLWITLSDKKPYYLVPSPIIPSSGFTPTIKADSSMDKKETFLWKICVINNVNCQVGVQNCA